MPISIINSGNCNFQYITHLRDYLGHPEEAMLDLLTVPRSIYSKPYTPDTYRKPSAGMYLFAQESDEKTDNIPYGPQFRAFIESNGLGEVTSHVAKNPLHYNRTGILYVWIINQDACSKWWAAQQKKAKANDAGTS